MGVGGWEGYQWAAAGGPRIMVTELHAGWPLEAQTIVQVMIELYPSKAQKCLVSVEFKYQNKTKHNRKEKKTIILNTVINWNYFLEKFNLIRERTFKKSEGDIFKPLSKALTIFDRTVFIPRRLNENFYLF